MGWGYLGLPAEGVAVVDPHLRQALDHARDCGAHLLCGCRVLEGRGRGRRDLVWRWLPESRKEESDDWHLGESVVVEASGEYISQSEHICGITGKDGWCAWG